MIRGLAGEERRRGCSAAVPHANGLERFAGDASRRGAQDEVFAVLLDRDFLKPPCASNVQTM